jgi:hypothetical protein
MRILLTRGPAPDAVTANHVGHLWNQPNKIVQIPIDDGELPDHRIGQEPLSPRVGARKQPVSCLARFHAESVTGFCSSNEIDVQLLAKGENKTRSGLFRRTDSPRADGVRPADVESTDAILTVGQRDPAHGAAGGCVFVATTSTP